ncbi:galectin-3-like [Microcaecilia unicolor]|uniref:Galectin n=1 Tax=Microcaecilia unicolor TaxID=1415580 RepID=A0A6P7Z3Z4_9AMPH|nr:galectin-3-like [Microcaecilia unicolor]XP_030070455.1 galectin-3-like [Microcaecilia unicolor]
MATGSRISVDHHLNGILIPHSIVTILGKIKPDPDRLGIDFRKDNRNICFHFNVRFKGSKRIICNNLKDNVFGIEEIKSDISPFSPGKTFKIDIECMEDCFKVSVDDNYLLTFNARMKPLKDINHINIWGDIEFSGCLITLK